MTTEKRSNEAVCERSEARTPAFWRVVREGIDGVREYASFRGAWTYKISEAAQFPSERIASFGCFTSERAVPVYHRVVKKPKGHGIGWAVKQLKAGKRVRRAAWQKGNYTDANHADSGGHVSYESLMANDWELAE